MAWRTPSLSCESSSIFTDGSQESYTLAAGTISSGKWTQLLNTGVALDWGTKVLKSGEIWISTAPYDATDATVPDLYVDDVAVQPAGESETALEPIVPTMTRSFKDKSSDTKGTRVYFGYTNPNSSGFSSSRQNSVQPGGDAGQPVVLEPGTVENAFELLVERTEPTVSWTLSGRTAAF